MFSHSWTTFQAPLMSSWGHFGACWNGHGSKNATNQAIWQLQYISFKSTIVGILWLWQAQSRLILEASWYFRGCPKKQDKTTPYFGSTFNHEPTVTKFTPFPATLGNPMTSHDPWPTMVGSTCLWAMSGPCRVTSLQDMFGRRYTSDFQEGYFRQSLKPRPPSYSTRPKNHGLIGAWKTYLGSFMYMIICVYIYKGCFMSYRRMELFPETTLR